jgi:hypothetical protein
MGKKSRKLMKKIIFNQQILTSRLLDLCEMVLQQGRATSPQSIEPAEPEAAGTVQPAPSISNPVQPVQAEFSKQYQ